MRRRFDTRAMVQGWLDAEAALADAQAAVGVIPAEAAARIRRKADANLYDFEPSGRASRSPSTARPRDPRAVVALWRAWRVRRLGRDDAGQPRSCCRCGPHLAWLTDAVDAARTVCVALTHEYADVAVAARTHGQHAVPRTFGLLGDRAALALRCDSRARRCTAFHERRTFTAPERRARLPRGQRQPRSP